jgi:hypothetical protein
MKMKRVLAGGLLLLASSLAYAVDSSGISYRIEGCNNDGSIVLPNGSGNFVCPDTAYTTGNLGKNWNELDLVPHRATLTAGNSAPASQSFDFAVAADNCKSFNAGTTLECANGVNGFPGYDFVSALTLNKAKSTNNGVGCSVSSDPMVPEVPGEGGTAVSIFVQAHATQNRNTVCVYDYYERLAVGASLYSGSSLHSDLLNPSGEKDVPLPVNNILPQGLRKDMSAVANASVSWDITKNSDSSVANFGDVCSPDLPGSIPATIHVVWTKVSTTSTGLIAIAHVYADNPSSRSIDVEVTDDIYKGTDQTTLLHETTGGSVTVPAHTELLVLTDAVTLLPGSGNVGDFLNDIAVASYTDPVTGFPIQGTTTAVAQAQIGTGTVADSTANVTDTESILDALNALSFSVPAPSVGSFLNYVAGTHTVGPVNWAATVTDSGSITFNKSVYLSGPIVTSGVLSDIAHLTTNDQSLSSAPVSINISSTATVNLVVSKTIPANYLQQPGDVLHVVIDVAGNGGYNATVPFDFVFGGPLTLFQPLNNLTPQLFVVHEVAQQFCDTANGCTSNTLLTPAIDPLTVDLSIPANGDMTGHCNGNASLVNIFRPQGVRVQAQKITSPASNTSWLLNIAGPTACDQLTVLAGATFSKFQKNGSDCLLGDGHYIVSEVQQSGYVQTDIPQTCEFDVDNIFNDGHIYSCTFHNRQLARASLFKTKSGVPDLSATDDFIFQLRSGADATHVGTILATFDANLADGFGGQIGGLLMPGSHYQLCEVVQPGWLSNIGTIVPNAFMPPDGVPVNPNVDNSILCVDFVLGDGENRTFNIDNTPPPGGRALTIGFWKNWSSCTGGHQKPTLDITLALPPAGVQLDGFTLTGPCSTVVNLLNKSTGTTGKKMASDPLFNLVAQLIAAELNVKAGAGICPKAALAIQQANALLTKYSFTVDGYKTKLSTADATLANNLATELDNYNNDRPSGCQ